MEQKALLTVQEAAAWIGVSEATIQAATFGGRLPFVRRSGRNWIELAQLHVYRKCAQSEESEGE